MQCLHDVQCIFCKSMENIESRRAIQRPGQSGEKERSTLIYSSNAHVIAKRFLLVRWEVGRLRLTAPFSLLNREVKSYRNRLRHLFSSTSEGREFRSTADLSGLSFEQLFLNLRLCAR